MKKIKKKNKKQTNNLIKLKQLLFNNNKLKVIKMKKQFLNKIIKIK